MMPIPKYTQPKHADILPLKHPDSIKQYEDKPDLDIWRAFNKGDELAFNYIYRMYATVMFQFGAQISKDEHILQDCIQNIFIDLRRKRGSLSEVQSIKAYLFKILQRELIRKINREKGTSYSSQDLNERFFPIEVSHETKLIQHEFDREKKQLVEGALNQLTVRQRQAILLLYEEGMSYREIAEVMELNEVKSARKIIYRALASLKTLLKNKD
ncbi:MAG: sigma-70 family RNA polymerase sigma factor [Anditalea sp.]